MAFQPKKIKRADVLKVLNENDRGEISVIPSTKFDILFQSKTYPPKDMIRLANHYSNSAHLREIKV